MDAELRGTLAELTDLKAEYGIRSLDALRFIHSRREYEQLADSVTLKLYREEIRYMPTIKQVNHLCNYLKRLFYEYFETFGKDHIISDDDHYPFEIDVRDFATPLRDLIKRDWEVFEPFLPDYEEFIIHYTRFLSDQVDPMEACKYAFTTHSPKVIHDPWDIGILFEVDLSFEGLTNEEKAFLYRLSWFKTDQLINTDK